jgi:hypothetical protein
MDNNKLSVDLYFNRTFAESEQAEVARMATSAGFVVTRDDGYYKEAAAGPEEYKLILDVTSEALKHIEDRVIDDLTDLVFGAGALAVFWKSLATRFREIVLISTFHLTRNKIRFYFPKNAPDAAFKKIPSTIKAALKSQDYGDQFWHDGAWKTVEQAIADSKTQEDR